MPRRLRLGGHHQLPGVDLVAQLELGVPHQLAVGPAQQVAYVLPRVPQVQQPRLVERRAA